MKQKNRELQEIAKSLNDHVYRVNIEASEKLLSAQDALYLAIFEDEKNEGVQKVINELKLESEDATLIAEACAGIFRVDFDGGPLDNPDHWIWELAAL